MRERDSYQYLAVLKVPEVLPKREVVIAFATVQRNEFNHVEAFMAALHLNQLSYPCTRVIVTTMMK